MNPYEYQEKEVFEQLRNKIEFEHQKYGKVINSAMFTQRIINDIQVATKYLREIDRRRVIDVLRGLKLEKRGKEECDCSESLGRCGCSVNDFNDAVEENNFAIELAISSLRKLTE